MTTGMLAPPSELRRTMRQHAAGVVVITTRAGGPVGFCATSLCTVSLEPPVVCFSVAVDSASGLAWGQAEQGLVHLLGADQAGLAAWFGRSGADKFANRDVGWHWGPGGQPLLHHVPGWLLVRVRERLAVGAHWLVVCDVREASVQSGTGALIRHDGHFHGVGR